MITSIRSRVAAIVRRITRPRLHRPEITLSHKVYGNDYGGWPLLDDLTPMSPLIFSFGVGRDISFDLAAIAAFGATVRAFDPTPRSLEWINRQTVPASFHFHPCGVAAQDGEITFFPPENEDNVSFSSQPVSKNKGEGINAPVRRLSSLVADYGVPDVLKMDIEGFEYAVLADMLAGDLRPAQLLVEFHHRMYDISNQTTKDMVDQLNDAGYLLFFVSEIGHEYAFVHKRLL